MVDLRNQLFMVSLRNIDMVMLITVGGLFITSNMLIGFESSAVILLVPVTGNNTVPV